MSQKTILLVGDSYRNPNLFYKTHFLDATPFIYLYHEGVNKIITPASSWEQAKTEANVEEVYPFSQFNYVKKLKTYGHKDLAFVIMLKEILDYLRIKEVTVAKDFPVFYANGLTKLGIGLHIDCDLFVKERSIKNRQEIYWIKETQAALEKGMTAAEEMIREAKPIQDDSLVYRNEILTSGKLKSAIEIALLEENCCIFDTIVACGPNSADPHYSGESKIWANKPILIDIFPYHRQHRYFADMSRTFVKGKGDPQLYKMYDAVYEAQQMTISRIRPGILGSSLYQTACNSFKLKGYSTLKDQKPSEPLLNKGFIHSVGHGIGLEIHESPFLFSQDIELKVGNVITIEPGLYDPEYGGVRIEDLVLVTENGYELISQYHKQFIIE